MHDQPVEVPLGFQEAMTKVDAAKPSQADISAALPDQFAVEVTGVRGEKRIDYKGVPIRNADGTLNKAGKNLLDLHAPAARVGADVTEKLKAGDYDDQPQHTEERERKQPLSADVALRVARAQKLTDVRALRPHRSRYHGISITDENGVPNLWMNEDRRLVRIALVGTRESSRVMVYLV